MGRAENRRVSIRRWRAIGVCLALVAATIELQPPDVSAAQAWRAAPEATVGPIVEMGWWNTCAIGTSRSLTCWGRNDDGESEPPEGQFIDVAPGSLSSCAIRSSDHMVECWGRSMPSLDVPVQRLAVSWPEVCAIDLADALVCSEVPEHLNTGGTFVDLDLVQGDTGTSLCAIRSSGALYCEDLDEPINSEDWLSQWPPGEFSEVSVGSDHACALRVDGSAACWGSDFHGESSPPPETFTHLDVGANDSCGILQSGQLRCWGRFVELGGSPPAGNFVSVSLPHTNLHSLCGVRGDGAVICWSYAAGDNDFGLATPVSSDFVEMHAGYGFTCGRRSTGRVRCSGWAGDWPAPSVDLNDSFSSISVSDYHLCGVGLADHRAHCNFSNDAGQSTPPSTTFQSTTAGQAHSCGLASDGTVQCWGSAYSGATAPPTGAFKQIDAGSWFTCGVRVSNTVACWGLNDRGQSTPPAGSFARVEAGLGHACGLRLDGSVECWGDMRTDLHAPPGGTFTDLSVAVDMCGVRTSGDVECWSPAYEPLHIPTQVAGSDFVDVSVGLDHTCGVREDGVFQCWGAIAALGEPIPGEYVPTVEPVRYAALGDSFSAGEGVRPYQSGTDSSTNKCHRSDTAYAALVRPPGETMSIRALAAHGQGSWDFRACSGAVVANIDVRGQYGERPQLAAIDSLPETPTLVTLTMGGNNVGFADLLTRCADPRFGDCRNHADNYVETRINGLRRGLTRVLGELRDRATSVWLINYPMLFPASRAEQTCAKLRIFTPAEQNKLRALQRDVHGAMRSAARSAGVHYVDATTWFAGHEICGRGGEWVSGLVRGGRPNDPSWTVGAGSFHPNSRGQTQYARLLEQVIAAQLDSGCATDHTGLPANPEPTSGPLTACG